MNFLDNALKFTEKGTIAFNATLVKVVDASKIIVKISVQDAGIGIPEDKQEAIFDRFVRLSPSGNNVYKGLGLGLWIVKQFVKDMGGEMEVRSEVGVGSTFSCIFPFTVGHPDEGCSGTTQ